jgi:hypothetical protein
MEVAGPSGTCVRIRQAVRCQTLATFRHVSITMHQKLACEFVVVQRNKERIYVRGGAIQYTIFIPCTCYTNIELSLPSTQHFSLSL